MRRWTVLRVVWCFVLFGIPVLAEAYYLRWTGGVGDWSRRSNWSDGIEPTSSDLAEIDNGGTALITQDGEAAKELILGWHEEGHVRMSAGTLTIETDETVSGKGESSFVQSGGAHWVKGNLWLTYRTSAPGNTGVFVMKGGTTRVDGNFYFGYDERRGICEVHGGTLEIGGSLKGRYDRRGISQLILDGGALNVGGVISVDDFHIGRDGAGFYTQANGNAVTVWGRLFLGENAGAEGTYRLVDGTLTVRGDVADGAGSGRLILDGGTLDARGALRVDDLWIAEDDSVSHEQVGGTVTVNREVRLGVNPGSRGAYRLGGGTLRVLGDIVQGDGVGEFYVDGGTLDFRGDSIILETLGVGEDAGSDGSFLLGPGRRGFVQEGGTNEVSVLLYVGSKLDAAGRYEQADGLLSVGDIEAVGRSGEGVFSQTGGTNTARRIHLAEYSAGSGTYELAGGRLAVGSYELVGRLGGGIFRQSGGTNETAELYLAERAGSTGQYELSGDGLLRVSNAAVVGDGGWGTFRQSGGTNRVEGDLHLARGSGSQGRYELTGGTLSVGGRIVDGPGDGVFVVEGGTLEAGGIAALDELRIGENAAGSYTQSAGTNTVSLVEIGISSGAEGTYVLDGGILSAGRVDVGSRGEGTMENRGGRHLTEGDLNVGLQAGGNGRYELGGSGTLQAPNEFLGNRGGGVLVQTAGSNAVKSVLYVGYEAGAEGRYELAGGSLRAGEEVVGKYGAGTFEQTGGDNTVEGALRIGRHAGAEGLYSLQGGSLSSGLVEIGPAGRGTLSNGGGVHVMSNHLYIGTYGGGDGRYELSGSGSLSAPREFLGNQGVGAIVQTGGTNTVAHELYLGYWAGGRGTYRLIGGTLSAGEEVVGRYGAGVFEQTGGTNTVEGGLYLGRYVESEGSYTIRGGWLEVRELHLGGEGVGRLEIAGSSAELEVSDFLHLGPGAAISADAPITVHMTGTIFENESTDPESLAGLANLELRFEGTSPAMDWFEVGGRDYGPVERGFDGNFAVGRLILAGVELGLTDFFDNRPDWDGSEALYVEMLVVEEDSLLDLNGLNVYCREAAIDPGATIEYNGGSVTVVPEPGVLVLLTAAAVGLRRRRVRSLCGSGAKATSVEGA